MKVEQLLPVELTSFEVRAEKEKVNLFWRTETEIENKGFYVERRSSDIGWEVLGFVNGNGTTMDAHEIFLR